MSATATERLGLREPLTIERGSLAVVPLASPAAGLNASFTTGSRNAPFVRVVTAKASLATDANVASRLLSLDYVSARAGTIVRNAATVLITANQAATVFQWDAQHTVSEWNTGTPVFVPLNSILLGPGWTIQLTVDNIQVGDQLSSISFLLEEFYADSPSDLPS